MPPEKIDSLADDVKPLGLLRQISVLTARVDELVAQNKALLARIAELEAIRFRQRARRAHGQWRVDPTVKRQGKSAFKMGRSKEGARLRHRS
jgi:hypothetical protein